MTGPVVTGPVVTGPGRARSRTDRKLRATAAASAYQRAWFGELTERARRGEPFVLVDADTPQEIFRAMDIPYVVSQWWASLVASRGFAGDCLAALRAHGYPDYSDQYSALALGSVLVPDPAAGPWGGLPVPDLVVTQVTSDAAGKIGAAWAATTTATFFPLERTVGDAPPAPWWDELPREWERLIGSSRLDVMTGELAELIAVLESMTGRRFSMRRLAEVMALVNEQEEWNARTRDLLAATVPAPVDIADTIPAVMIPQWHRGTRWAADAARALHDEVAEAVSSGAAACPGERVRLMWIGRGLWFDLGFYQYFRDELGAVFVWSMYLAIAADGYLRYGPDPLRCLAARFAGFADLLGMPGWADRWYLKEARRHQVDGVVHLVAEESRSPYFITATLAGAGIPVLELRASNADDRGWDATAARAAVAEFIRAEAAPAAARRIAGRAAGTPGEARPHDQ